MALVTLRLNEQEEKILDLLVRHSGQDKSKVLKDALWDMFEDLRDRELIEDYESRSRAGKVEFATADDLASLLEEKAPAYSVRIERPATAAKPTKTGKARKGRTGKT